MRSSRPNRRERRAAHFSRSSHPSSGQFASGVLALGALVSAFQVDSVKAEVLTSAPNSPRSSQSNVAPRVTILQPSYADLIKGTTQIVIAVETKGAPTKNVEMFIDGVSATGGAAALAGLNSAQFDWKTTTVKDGLRRLTVRVTDENGLRGEAETQVYINNSRKADKTAPTLNWQNVRNGELLHGETKLQLGASDNFGVKYIVITVNPVDQPDRTPALRASLINRAPFEYSLDTTRLPDGVYVLNARAYDMLDNEGSTQRVTFGVTNNGLNPTVIERLNEVLAAQNPATSSTRSSEIATKVLPKLQPKDNLRTPKSQAVKPQVTKPQTVKPQVTKPQTVIAPVQSVAPPKIAAPKVVAAKPQIVKPVATPDVTKTTPVRVAAATVKAPVVKPQTPSIAVARPVIERPALTSAANAQTLSGAAVVTALPSTSSEAATPTKIDRVTEQPRLASVPKTTPKARVSSPAKATETLASTTVANTENSSDMIGSGAMTQTVSTRESSNEAATQRAQTPQTPTRLAKMPDLRVPKANLEMAAIVTETAQNVVEVATSQVATEAPQNIEYSMSPRASLEAVAPRKTSRLLAAPVRIVVAPGVEKTSSELAPQITSVAVESAPLALANEKLSPQNGELSLQIVPKLSLAAPVSKPLPQSAQPVRIAQVPKLRAPKPNASATITPTAATAKATTNIVESHVDVVVAETKSVFVPQRIKTPQRLAALPTRRDEAISSDFAAPLSAKVRHNAAITVSPITMAAMQTRGSQAFVPASHVVKKGETLAILASRYGLKAETLASVNGLKTAGILSVGQKLSLPRALKVSYQGIDGSGDVQAMQIGDVSAAPFRFLFEQQGGTMTWDKAAQRVTASNGSHHVSITIGSREANVGDQKVMMDLAAFLLSGRTMVPVRFFERAFDTKVEWEPATSRIYVAMSNDSVLNR